MYNKMRKALYIPHKYLFFKDSDDYIVEFY